MIETGVVINIFDEPIHWHEPQGRSGGNLPDSPQLWDVLWNAHQHGWLRGFAHSHPGVGVPSPSQEDLSTFVAIETALGRPLMWWITSADRCVAITRSLLDSIPGREVYAVEEIRLPKHEPTWVAELRHRSEISTEIRIAK